MTSPEPEIIEDDTPTDLDGILARLPAAAAAVAEADEKVAQADLALKDAYRERKAARNIFARLVQGMGVTGFTVGS